MPNPGDTQFPTALPTPDTLFRVVNFDTTTTLATSISAGDLSIVLTDASLYGASGSIKIEDEYVFYTSKSTNTLTIPASGGRGADGSTAAIHSSGATVRAVAIARHHMVLAEEIAALGAKMGIGADTPQNGDFFKGTGTGTSGWSALSSGEVVAALTYTPAPVVTLTAGDGLTGGGTTASNRTFDVVAGNGITVAADSVSVNQAFAFTWTGINTFTPAARSSGSSPYLTINAPADTGLTADTEAIGVSWVGATRQHADGTTQTNQREHVFAFPTYSAAGPSIITNSATVAITGAPAAGTNMTLTNPYALWVQAGVAEFSGGLRDKGGQVFNVKSYGAKADGSTDDAPAFTSAIAAAAAVRGGIVFVPQSTTDYIWASTVTIGDGTAPSTPTGTDGTVSTYNGVRLIGAGGTFNDGTGTPTCRIKWAGSSGGTMLKIAGPISGVVVEGLNFNCVGASNTAGIGIQTKHADGCIIRQVEIKGATSVALDIDAYDTTGFNGNTITGVLAQDGLVENVYINNVAVNNATLVRVGATGSISGWNFMGGRWRADGSSGSTVLQLSFADHNNFWGITGKAAVGVRYKSLTGHTIFPVNNPLFFCSMNGSNGANAYQIDNSTATWASSAGYGAPIFGLPTIDGAATPVHDSGVSAQYGLLWGFNDKGEFFGVRAGWKFGLETDLTNTAATLLTFKHTTSGTATTNFGLAQLTQLEAGSGTLRDASKETTYWTDPTDATPDSAIKWEVSVNNTLTEAFRVEFPIITLAGVARRFQADMSNATISNRFGFQTSTANSSTVMSVIPNGSSTTSAVRVFGGSDPDNAPYAGLLMLSTGPIIESSKNGTGTTQALSFSMSGTPVAGITTTGIFNHFKGADVASAGTITATGNVFHVTGTTNITSVSGTGINAGTMITIIFDGILTFTDGSNLKLAGNYVTTANDTITLIYDGTNWYEVCRSLDI